MTFDTYRAAKNSLHEFTPALRAAHAIVRYYSTTHQRYRYARVYGRA
jgi:hypothetical protein